MHTPTDGYVVRRKLAIIKYRVEQKFFSMKNTCKNNKYVFIYVHIYLQVYIYR